MCKTEGNRHDFYRDDADLFLGVGGLDASTRIELVEEVGVGIETNAYSVYKGDREFGMRSVPVSCVLSWRAVCCEEGIGSEGKESEESREGGSVEVEAAVEELHVQYSRKV